MNETLFILIFVCWYVFSLIISETLGKKRKIGVEWSFFISMIFSPVIGFPITFYSKRKKLSEP